MTNEEKKSETYDFVCDIMQTLVNGDGDSTLGQVVFCSEADFKHRFATIAEQKLNGGKINGVNDDVNANKPKIYLEYKMCSFLDLSSDLQKDVNSGKIINVTRDHLDLVIRANDKMIPIEFKYIVDVRRPRQRDGVEDAIRNKFFYYPENIEGRGIYYRYDDRCAGGLCGGFDVKDDMAVNDTKYGFLTDIERLEQALTQTRYKTSDVGYAIFLTNFHGFWENIANVDDTCEMRTHGVIPQNPSDPPYNWDWGKKHGKNRDRRIFHKSYNIEWNEVKMDDKDWPMSSFEYTIVEIDKKKFDSNKL